MCSNRNDCNIKDLFNSSDLVKVCAPMVRYSKLQFRNLVKQYNCDLCFTPMILADSFCKSEKARQNEFSTNQYDVPVVTQFAANTVHDFVGASYMVSPYCNGVDLNCGCPQRWAKQLGLGCSLLKTPQSIYDMVRQCRNHITKSFTVSVKMRILPDLNETLEICRQIEMCGVDFLTIHARTSSQLNGDANKDALRMICEDSNVPIIANGDVKSLKDCLELKSYSKCDGVMSANGILSNPTLFTGSEVTTIDCLQNWLDICYNSTIRTEDFEQIDDLNPRIAEKPFNLTFQCFHHHLVFMLEKLLSRSERQIFNNLQTFADVLNYIEIKFGLKPRLYDREKFTRMHVRELSYECRDSIYHFLKPNSIASDWTIYDADKSDGTFFRSRMDDLNDCDLSNIFLEGE